MSFSLYIKNLLKIGRRKYSHNKHTVFSFLSILEKNYPPSSHFSFILVGANDGVSHDLLYPFLKGRDCSGVAFEPDSRAFSVLVRNYRSLSKVKLINKAIHASVKELLLYKVDPARLHDLPEWASGISSLDADHYKRSGIPADAIIEEKVNAGNLMDLLSEYYPETSIDLLQVDVEGYDLEILKQCDLKKIQPRIIRFEYTNLTEADTVSAIDLLKQHGYYCFYEDADVIAIKTRQVRL